MHFAAASYWVSWIGGCEGCAGFGAAFDLAHDLGHRHPAALNHAGALIGGAKRKIGSTGQGQHGDDAEQNRPKRAARFWRCNFFRSNRRRRGDCLLSRGKSLGWSEVGRHFQAQVFKEGAEGIGLGGQGVIASLRGFQGDGHFLGRGKSIYRVFGQRFEHHAFHGLADVRVDAPRHGQRVLDVLENDGQGRIGAVGCASGETFIKHNAQ